MRGGLFSTGGGLFLVGGGLFPSPTVAEKSPTPARKSPTPAEKSPTAIPKRCWTLEYSGELEFSSPFMEQWTLDARGVLLMKEARSSFQKLTNAKVSWRSQSFERGIPRVQFANGHCSCFPMREGIGD